jgi:hypothetical protein
MIWEYCLILSFSIVVLAAVFGLGLCHAAWTVWRVCDGRKPLRYDRRRSGTRSIYPERRRKSSVRASVSVMMHIGERLRSPSPSYLYTIIARDNEALLLIEGRHCEAMINHQLATVTMPTPGDPHAFTLGHHCDELHSWAYRLFSSVNHSRLVTDRFHISDQTCLDDIAASINRLLLCHHVCQLWIVPRLICLAILHWYGLIPTKCAKPT